MAFEDGLLWLLAVDTADNPSTPTWSTLPQQRSVTFTPSHTDADGTTKDSLGWEDSRTVRRALAFDAAGLWADNDPALEFLLDTKFFGALATDIDEPVGVRLTTAIGDTYIGQTTLEEFPIEAPEGELVSWSATFKFRGVPTVLRV